MMHHAIEKLDANKAVHPVPFHDWAKADKV